MPGQNLDLFYEIMQDTMRGIDMAIAGHVSDASKIRTQANDQNKAGSQIRPMDNDSDLDIQLNSPFWSDEEEDQTASITAPARSGTTHQRQISRYLSAVNRSLLDKPSDVVTEFYISQLNKSMKDSVRNVESISRDKAQKRRMRNQEFKDDSESRLGRSLSAEHLYQVRKEHLRYRQPFTTPTSFTVEDVADIYKPFALENYKRKICIEVERRRREKQLQLSLSMT